MAATLSTSRVVGRARELAILGEALGDARSGRPGCVLVDGEAGVGKTRLVHELHERARRRDMWTLLGHCIPTRGSIPFAPVVEVLRKLARDLGPARFEVLAGGARQELARLVPGLAAADRPAPDLDLDSAQGRLFELLLGFLGRLAADGGAVVTIEDLHWSDRSTQDLLSFLARELSDERVLLVGTYRPEELVAGHALRPLLAGLFQAKHARRVELRPFSRAEVVEQLAAILGEQPDPVLAERILERSEGNAFFVEELLEAGGGAQDELPRTLRDAFMTRVERLSERAQGLLRIAAVAGREVDHDLLSQASVLAEPELTGALREAVDRHLLVPTGEGYAFRHALLKEAVHQDLLPGERAALHGACARALRARLDRAGQADPAALAELASHWDEARDPEAALLASFEAGRAALSVYAFAEAHAQLERVLALWGQVPGAGRALGHEQVELLQETAETANLLGRHDRAVELVRAALAEAAGTRDESRAGLLHERLAHYLWESGDREGSFRVAEEAARAARSSPPSAPFARALTALARTRLLTGRTPEARRLAEQALEVARGIGARREECVARQVLGLALVLVGEAGRGEEQLRAAALIAVDIGHVQEIAAAHVTLVVVRTALGRLDAAAGTAREAMDVARRLGFERTCGLWLKANLAQVLARLGRWEEARALASEVVDGRHSPAQVASQLAHLTLGQLALGRGDLGPARAHLRAAGATGARQWTDPLPGVVAELELWAGEEAQARRTVARGLEGVPPGTEERGDAAVLCWLGVRLEADRGERARALQDHETLGRARAAGARLLDRMRAIVARAREPGHVLLPEVAALAVTAEGERSRLDGAADPDLWASAARRWRRLGQPLQRAYALWREADAWLAGPGDRGRAAAPLRRAHEVSVRLGAALLDLEVERLARRARIELDGEAAAAPDPTRPPSAAERLGLTPRELDVLDLLVDGRTNGEIAARLFISDKTASVHVSHILRKLRVANRVEAAGVAYRLGLVQAAT